MVNVAKSTEVITQTVATSTFSFEDYTVRTLLVSGEPWFVAVDLCQVLRLGNPAESVRKLDDDEKGISSIDTLGGKQQMVIVSESGMYALVLRCRDAMKQGSTPYKLRKWVTNEILPSIRKTGGYQIPANRKMVPLFRYVVSLNYKDTVTGQEETFTGGCNSPEEIIRGTAKRFGIFIPEMINMPVNAYY